MGGEGGGGLDIYTIFLLTPFQNCYCKYIAFTYSYTSVNCTYTVYVFKISIPHDITFIVNRLSTAFSINNKLPSWNIVQHHVHFPEHFFD